MQCDVGGGEGLLLWRCCGSGMNIYRNCNRAEAAACSSTTARPTTAGLLLRRATVRSPLVTHVPMVWNHPGRCVEVISKDSGTGRKGNEMEPAMSMSGGWSMGVVRRM